MNENHDGCGLVRDRQSRVPERFPIVLRQVLRGVEVLLLEVGGRRGGATRCRRKNAVLRDEALDFCPRAGQDRVRLMHCQVRRPAQDLRSFR